VTIAIPREGQPLLDAYHMIAGEVALPLIFRSHSPNFYGSLVLGTAICLAKPQRPLPRFEIDTLRRGFFWLAPVALPVDRNMPTRPGIGPVGHAFRSSTCAALRCDVRSTRGSLQWPGEG
jgi:hypothetical protein